MLRIQTYSFFIHLKHVCLHTVRVFFGYMTDSSESQNHLKTYWLVLFFVSLFDIVLLQIIVFHVPILFLPHILQQFGTHPPRLPSLYKIANIHLL
jgi:hypothetical protein